MPAVPVSGGPTVVSGGVPQPRTAPEDFGGGQAAKPFELSDTTRAATAIYQQQKQDANEIAVTAAAARASAAETNRLWNPQSGAMTRKGLDALQAQDDAQKGFQEDMQDIESGLSNDEQKLAFRRIAAAHGTALNDTLTRHVAQEKETYDTETTNGFVTNERNAAIANYTDPQRITESIGNQQAALADYARRTGKPAEWLQQQATQAASDTHVAVIDRLLANEQDTAAQAYRDAHRDQILGSAAAQVDKAVEEGSSRAASQHAAATILSEGGTLTEQVAKARALAEKDPRVADLTEARLRKNDAETKEAAREQAEASMTTAGNILDRTGGNVASIPPSMWTTFSPSQKASLKSYGDAIQGGGSVKTDWSTWVSLRDLASNPKTRQQFLNLDPMSYRSRLGDAQFQEITGLREGLRTKDAAAESTADDIGRVHSIISGSLKGIGVGIDPKKRAPDAEISDVVYRSVDAQIESLQERTKTKATTKQIQEITDEILTQHLVQAPGRFWGTNEETKRTFQVQPTDELVVTAKDIPPADRTAIAQSLRSRGLPATPDAIVAAYKAHVKGLVQRGPR
jgi:hypothetical protein